MAASAPRKTAAKKAAPRRTPDERRESHVLQIEEFRSRARQLRLGPDKAEIEPYVIHAETLDDGIDADVVLQLPKDFRERMAFDRAVRAGDFPRMLEILGGTSGVNRIINMCAVHEESTGEDAARFFTAIGYSVLNKFNGPGSNDVPGGTPAS